MECLDGHLTQTGILDGVENSQHLVAALEVGFSYLRLKQGPRLALSGSRYSVGRQRRIVNNILLQRLGSLTGKGGISLRIAIDRGHTHDSETVGELRHVDKTLERSLVIMERRIDHGTVQSEINVERVVLWKDRKSTRLNSSHANISYAVFCLKKKKTKLRNM